MRVVPASEVGAEAWDRYVSRHPGGWFWHRRGWLEYQAEYFRAGVDASFAVLDRDERVAAVQPLFLCRRNNCEYEMSYGGRPVPAGLSDGPEASVHAVSYVALVASKYRTVRAVFEVGESSSVPVRANQAGYSREVKRRVVDLDEMRWSDVRSSYRSLIHRAEREYRIDVHGGDYAATVAAFAKYQQLHRKVYDSPRPDATYRMQGEWLLDDAAAVAVAENAAAVWGSAYWFVAKDEAYYGSGAYAARDVSHAVIWRSLMELQRRGVKRAVMGYVGEAETDKGRAIEFFKTGFGGRDEIVTRVVAEFA